LSAGDVRTVASIAPIPFLDLRRATLELADALRAAIAEVVAGGSYVLGPRLRAFETAFADACGARHAVGVASGTDALELGLRALEIGPGDEVVTQANTCVPTVAAIERTGATPVLCDVDPLSGAMDPASLEAALGPRTRAVIPVHLYGHPADMRAIGDVAARHGIAVVEDCAQAHGASFDGRPAGTMGAIGCFSFYPTKNLGALGDAGAAITNDPRLADRLRMLRQYGRRGPDEHVVPGVNSRLDELQAAVLGVKLEHLTAWNRRRRAIAIVYDEAVRDTPVTPLARDPRAGHVFHLYVVRSRRRAALREKLADRGIATLVHYPRPVHRLEAYRRLADGPTGLVAAERLADEVVSIPCHPHLDDAEVAHVAEALRTAAIALDEP